MIRTLHAECDAGRSVGDSKGQIDDLDPLVGVDDLLAPDGVEIGKRHFRVALTSSSQCK